MAVFRFKGRCMARVHCRAGAEGHVLQMAHLVLAVPQHAVKKAGRSVLPAVLFHKGRVFHIHIVCVGKNKFQRQLMVLAEIHKRVHFLVRHAALPHRPPCRVRHVRSVHRREIIRLYPAAQHPLRRIPRAPRGNDDGHTALRQLPQRLHRGLAGAGRAIGHQRAVNVEHSRFDLHANHPFRRPRRRRFRRSFPPLRPS